MQRLSVYNHWAKEVQDENVQKQLNTSKTSFGTKIKHEYGESLLTFYGKKL